VNVKSDEQKFNSLKLTKSLQFRHEAEAVPGRTITKGYLFYFKIGLITKCVV